MPVGVFRPTLFSSSPFSGAPLPSLLPQAPLASLSHFCYRLQGRCMRRFLCRLPGRAIYRYLSRFVCRFPGRSRYRHLDRFVYRLPDRSINRPLGRFMYRLPDRFLGRLIDRFLGRLLDRLACRLHDRVPYHPPKGFLARLFSSFAFAFLAALVTPLSSAARPPVSPSLASGVWILARLRKGHGHRVYFHRPLEPHGAWK